MTIWTPKGDTGVFSNRELEAMAKQREDAAVPVPRSEGVCECGHSRVDHIDSMGNPCGECFCDEYRAPRSEAQGKEPRGCQCYWCRKADAHEAAEVRRRRFLEPFGLDAAPPDLAAELFAGYHDGTTCIRFLLNRLQVLRSQLTAAERDRPVEVGLNADDFRVLEWRGRRIVAFSEEAASEFKSQIATLAARVRELEGDRDALQARIDDMETERFNEGVERRMRE